MTSSYLKNRELYMLNLMEGRVSTQIIWTCTQHICLFYFYNYLKISMNSYLLYTLACNLVCTVFILLLKLLQLQLLRALSVSCFVPLTYPHLCVSMCLCVFSTSLVPGTIRCYKLICIFSVSFLESSISSWNPNIFIIGA